MIMMVTNTCWGAKKMVYDWGANDYDVNLT